jgi:transposase
MHVMHQLELTQSQISILQKQVHLTRDAKVLRRALALLNLYRGRSAWEIAWELQVSSRTLYRWVDDLEFETQLAAAGNSDVAPSKDLGGRPRLWEEELEEWLEALLSYFPIQLGYTRTGWTLPLLKAHFKRWHNENISIATLRRRLHELGYVWKRARYVLKPDPMKDKKMAEIQGKMKILSDRDVVICIDETDLLLFPPLRSTWGKQAESTEVEISGRNEKRVIYGGLNITSGHLLLMSRDRHRIPDFQAFLRLISNQYRGWHPILLLDEHPSHISPQSQALANLLGFELWWLPKRAPELNPIETLWGKTKEALLANYQSQDIDEQVDQFIMTLLDLSPATVLQASGLQSGNHWLAKN